MNANNPFLMNSANLSQVYKSHCRRHFAPWCSFGMTERSNGNNSNTWEISEAAQKMVMMFKHLDILNANFYSAVQCSSCCIRSLVLHSGSDKR